MFSNLPDPRASNTRHRLSDVMFIALAASLCGAQSAVDYAQFARSKRGLLESFLGPFDPPSHDTFSRLFRRLDPEAFGQAFAAFARGFAAALGDVVALDGKAMRRAYEAGGRAWPPIIVSAWAAEARLVLGALKAEARAGEGEAATAVRLIGLLDLDGALVTGDALHCTRAMTAAIRARGGDYVLALKGNRGPLKAAAEAVLAEASTAQAARTEETSHGRRETRTARVAAIGSGAERHGFAGFSHVAEVTAVRDSGEPTRRLFIASRALGADDMLAVTRAHWSVENSLHWSLDVIFGEDQVRARKDHAPANIALINRLAKTLLERIDDPKTSIRQRIKKCAWEDKYLTKAISHMQ